MKLQEIDYQPLFDWVNETLKTNVEFQFVWECDKPIIMPDLKGFSGIFAEIVDSVHIEMYSFDYNGSRLIANFQLVVKYRYEEVFYFHFGRAIYIKDLNWVFEAYQPNWLNM